MAATIRLIIIVEKAINLPVTDVIGLTDPYVEIKTIDKNEKAKGKEHKTKIIKVNTEPVWNEDFAIGEVLADDVVHFTVWDHDSTSGDDFVGLVHMPVSDLIRRPKWEFLLTAKNGDCVSNESSGLPSFLHIGVKIAADGVSKIPTPAPSASDASRYARHAMLITRGTRGDIQPFMALARGLAELKGWMVTVCTELPYKGFVKQYSNVSRGCIRFRPCGGDTGARVDEPMAKWAMNQTTELMQMAMLSRSEAEFFTSEPAFYYWACSMQPNVVIFGFTLANIALIINERLTIPIVGFILQPTCIPSNAYSPIVSIETHSVSLLDKMEQGFTSHNIQQKLRKMMEDNPLTKPLSSLRKRRGLRPLRGDSWSTIVAMNIPLVIPIIPFTFGGKPRDWNKNAELTTFIFLRGPSNKAASSATIPAKLPPVFDDFIRDAKASKAPIVVMAFSSMPVPRELILQLSVSMTEECSFHPRVIALVGNRDLSQEKLDKKMETKVYDLKAQKRILEEKGAPFGDLFPHMDCIIVHGGLGTTAEAMRVGVPVIVTGVMLMDQRFWGQRVNQMGIGPKPCHVNDFKKVCVEYLNKALDPSDPEGWRAEAKFVAEKMQKAGFTEEGVKENADAVERLADPSFYTGHTGHYS